MRILLSVYSCAPHRGSEPGVGWNWAQELPRLGHEVTVLTRERNRVAIERELATHPPDIRPAFAFYDPPSWWLVLKRGLPGLYLYYFVWQWGAAKLARRLHAQRPFDRVHHVTMVSLRGPSFMGCLGIPFIFGPVGGGERAPWRLRRGYGLTGHLADLARDISNAWVRLDPFMRRTFRQAQTILTTSAQSRDVVPKRFRSKARVQLAIGIAGEKNSAAQRLRGESSAGRLLFVGRFLYWKGMHLGLEAFAQVRHTHPGARLTMLGTGPMRGAWSRLARRLDIVEAIEWVDWTTQDQLARFYQEHDALFFPSLHDSGGLVVLEALARGLPAICLGLGGPGEIVDAGCGWRIPVEGRSREEVIEALAQAAGESFSHPRDRRAMLARANHFSWRSQISRALSV